jgi:hypothetical protein
MNFIAVVSIVELASIRAHNFELACRDPCVSGTVREIGTEIANMGAEMYSQSSCAKIWFLTCPLQKDSYSFVKTAIYGATRGAPLGCSLLLRARGPAAVARTQGLCTSHVTVCDHLNQII